MKSTLRFLKTNSKTSNNQRLRSAGNNDRRSKPLSALVKTHLLQRRALRKFYVTDGQNTRDQSAFCRFHASSVEVQTNAGYIHATHA